MALQERNLSTRNTRPTLLTSEVGIGNGLRDPKSARDSSYLIALTEEFVASPKFDDINRRRVKEPDSSALGDFRSSVAFLEAFLSANNRIDRFTTYDDFSTWLTGHLFESLAWHEISVSTKGVLLPESYVADLLKEVGNVELFNSSDGRDSASKTYIPDGILVENGDNGPQISSVYEYTTSTDFNKFYNQIHGFTFVKDHLGDLVSEKTSLVFVVPSFPADELGEFERSLRRASQQGRGKNVPFQISTLPVSRSQFSQFKGYVLNRFTLDGSDKTLGEQIRERETMLDGLYAGKKARRQELAVRINNAFETGNQESLDYVGRYIAGYELPVRGFRKVSVVTLPRSSPQSIGEPSDGVWRKVEE